jgi:hypothetical protein
VRTLSYIFATHARAASAALARLLATQTRPVPPPPPPPLRPDVFPPTGEVAAKPTLRLVGSKVPSIGLWGFNETFTPALRRALHRTYPASAVHSYLGAVTSPKARERDPAAEALWSMEWLDEVERASMDHPNGPLTTLVFRPMWNLVNGRDWSVGNVVTMAKRFLDGIDGVGDRHLKGFLLGDDFSRYPYNKRWDEIVRRVHGLRPDANVPFYFTNHFASPANRGGIYEHGADLSERYLALVKWLHVFQEVGAPAVFMPQFFPQAQNQRDVVGRWRSIFEALEALQQRDAVPEFEVQPVIQASAYNQPRGTTGPELLEQLEATLGYVGDLKVTGVWLMAWTAMDSHFHWGAESHWRGGHEYADVVGRFLSGSGQDSAGGDR